MRLYTFGNFYLSSIQQGIQAAHLVADMFGYTYQTVRHTDTKAVEVMYDWAQNHKTMVCLNGGNNADLDALYIRLYELGQALELPFDKFHEDRESLNSVMTCCGIIVPANIYEASQAIREGRYSRDDVVQLPAYGRFTVRELDLIFLLNEYGLAR